VAKLLVSVRSSSEALAALAGGAEIIDVKEPLNGSLGRSTFAVWRNVRGVVPPAIPISVALGELNEWFGRGAVEIPRNALLGVAYCKVGLSHARSDWVDRWFDLRKRIADSAPSGPAWVAVIYADCQTAGAPEPYSVIRVAGELDECHGVLFDTWGKSQRSGLDLTWKPIVDRVRDTGRFVALAGSLDATAIERLAPLAPDIFAVRGAACVAGDRLKPIDAERVSVLAHAARNVASEGRRAHVSFPTLIAH
jgi:uncharacterized protein (UPF0264 family)